MFTFEVGASLTQIRYSGAKKPISMEEWGLGERESGCRGNGLHRTISAHITEQITLFGKDSLNTSENLADPLFSINVRIIGMPIQL